MVLPGNPGLDLERFAPELIGRALNKTPTPESRSLRKGTARLRSFSVSEVFEGGGMANIERVELAPGYSISRVIKGSWQLAGGHGAVDAANAHDDMRRFVDAGITTFDCADIYTGVEEMIGRFLRQSQHAMRAGEMPPVEVHTKCVPDLDRLPQLRRADVEATVDRSLCRLGVERLDLVQLHWWDYDIHGYVDAAGWLHALEKQGKIRHLGVTNFDAEHLLEIVREGIPIVSNQVQYSVLDRRPEPSLSAVCREHGISL
ncbi:MAG: aldo/keto reductase, partial [Candidatus Bipolaricaulis sp.]|nr:aldo/keto reductase [Candidatus Bipolaricaulis sp.]